MTTAQVVETLVTANNNSPIQDYVHPDDQTQPFLIHIIKVIPLSWNCASLTAQLSSRVSDSGDDSLVGKRKYKSVIWEKAAVAGKRKEERACDHFFYDPLLPIIVTSGFGCQTVKF